MTEIIKDGLLKDGLKLKLRCIAERQKMKFVEPNGSVFYVLDSSGQKTGTSESQARQIVSEYIQVSAVCSAETPSKCGWSRSVQPKLDCRKEQLRVELMDICVKECFHIFKRS